MNFEDLNRVISQEIGDNKRTSLEIAVETKDLAIIVEELFL